MTGKTHQLIGLVTGIATYLSLAEPSYNPATAGFVVVASSIAALLPDADQPSSRIWQTIPLGRVAGELVDPFLQHRNVSHSLLGLGLVGWASHWLLGLVPDYWGVNFQLVWISLLASYASHLLADMVTIQGIPLLFPFQRMYGLPPRPFHGLRIQTGRWFENLVIFPLVNLALIGLLWATWPKISRILFQ